jgi:hypothetical protein
VFYVVWGIAGTVGPVALVVGLLSGSSVWWVGAVFCVVWGVTLWLDWLLVQRLRRTVEGWTPWEPRWSWLRK